MDDFDYYKLPRLYSAEKLKTKADVTLPDSQTHYIKNVMRRQQGDYIRLFDAKNGEFLGKIKEVSKKSVLLHLEKCLKEQPKNERAVRFVFSPIKKNRMDWMIEKMVELGVTEFQPVLFQNTEVRKIKEDRMDSQIIEAAEQCERLTIPTLKPLKKLDPFLKDDTFNGQNLACLERFKNSQPLDNTSAEDVSFLIGPEGGFTQEEKMLLAKTMTAIDLGKIILRCETAAMKTAILLTQ